MLPILSRKAPPSSGERLPLLLSKTIPSSPDKPALLLSKITPSSADKKPLLLSKATSSSADKKPLLISKACAEDLEEILALYIDAIKAMEQRGIHQWDELYPAKPELLCADIAAGEMWIGRIDGTAAVVFVLNEQFDEEYLTGAWQYPDLPFRIIHRLCVHPDFGGQGIGTRTMHEIEAICLAEGAGAIRFDAFTQNPAALAMYKKLGFARIGSAQWRKGLFWLYEKRLTEDGTVVERT